MKCIAVDWSGAKDGTSQKKKIWMAEAVNGELLRLENDRTRDEVVDVLIEKVQSREEVVIGLDFAFSFPEWFLGKRRVKSARKLWTLAASNGESWLSGNCWPFWGRPGPFRQRPQDLSGDMEFRQTEAALRGRGYKPKSVFQVNGGGAVGTGSIRGLPILAQLQDAGAVIWPFDPPTAHMVIEIYPRSLTGEVVKSRCRDRTDYLAQKHPALDPKWKRAMAESEDAFDAGVSALAMSAHAGDFGKLKPAPGPPESLEGEIWSPS